MGPHFIVFLFIFVGAALAAQDVVEDKYLFTRDILDKRYSYKHTEVEFPTEYYTSYRGETQLGCARIPVAGGRLRYEGSIGSDFYQFKSPNTAHEFGYTWERGPWGFGVRASYSYRRSRWRYSYLKHWTERSYCYYCSREHRQELEEVNRHTHSPEILFNVENGFTPDLRLVMSGSVGFTRRSGYSYAEKYEAAPDMIPVEKSTVHYTQYQNGYKCRGSFSSALVRRIHRRREYLLRVGGHISGSISRYPAMVDSTIRGSLSDDCVDEQCIVVFPGEKRDARYWEFGIRFGETYPEMIPLGTRYFLGFLGVQFSLKSFGLKYHNSNSKVLDQDVIHRKYLDNSEWRQTNAYTEYLNSAIATDLSTRLYLFKRAFFDFDYKSRKNLFETENGNAFSGSFDTRIRLGAQLVRKNRMVIEVSQIGPRMNFDLIVNEGLPDFNWYYGGGLTFLLDVNVYLDYPFRE